MRSLYAVVDHARDVVDRLRLDRTVRRAGALVVEGIDDRVVLTRAFQVDVGQIFPIGGRRHVLRAAELADAYDLTGVVCVADRDYEPAEGSESNRVVFYDGADLEEALFDSQLLAAFVDRWGVSQKLVERFGSIDGLRTKLRESWTFVAQLRLYNVLYARGIDFDSLKLPEYLDKQTLDFDTDKLARRLVSERILTSEEIESVKLLALPASPYTGVQLTRGKDLLAGCDVSLRSAVASLSAQQVSGQFSQRVLVGMVGPHDFERTPFAERLEGALKSAAA